MDNVCLDSGSDTQRNSVIAIKFTLLFKMFFFFLKCVISNKQTIIFNLLSILEVKISKSKHGIKKIPINKTNFECGVNEISKKIYINNSNSKY